MQVTQHAARLASALGQMLLDGLFTRRRPIDAFKLTSYLFTSFAKLLDATRIFARNFCSALDRSNRPFR